MSAAAGRASVRVAAVDLGATSGRVIAAEVGPDRLHLAEAHRFPNGPLRTPDGLHWNLLELYAQVLTGLQAANRSAGPDGLAGVAVDSWAVDYGLLRDGRLLGTPYHYRDEARTATGPDRVHAVVPHAQLYARNGLQFLPFNTLYQLAADPWVGLAERMLLVPDLLGHWLTGADVTERTNASTTGLLDVSTGGWDVELAGRLGIPSGLLGELVDPGAGVGALRPELAASLGLPEVPVTAVGSHDTASAVVGVPMTGPGAAYVSCGTWGLVGVELDKPVLTDAARSANFTNEGGVDGRVRFLTNVMGLWLLSESIRWWQRGGHEASLTDLLAEAAYRPGDVPVFDVQDPRFLAPGDLPDRIAEWYAEHDLPAPADRPAMVRAIVESLAQAFTDAVERAGELSGERVERIHVVGGGSLNQLLCQRIADRSGRPVLAGPVEATALGNVLVQARTHGAVTGTLEDLRGLVARTHQPTTFTPRRVREG